MDTRLIVLELVLKALDVEPSIETLADRIRIQKAVYLSKMAGVPLGYRFSWYVRGPYSPGLTRDYYDLQLASEDSARVSGSRRLQDNFLAVLKNITPIMYAPQNVLLTQSDWLELVSSVHYLRTVGAYDEKGAEKRLRELKPSLSKYTKQAENSLKHVGLLPA